MQRRRQHSYDQPKRVGAAETWWRSDLAQQWKTREGETEGEIVLRKSPAAEQFLPFHFDQIAYNSRASRCGACAT
jgi:hypothetical protein